MTNHLRLAIAVPHVLSLSCKGFREDRGGFGGGEAEARFCRGKSGGELRMILAEVLGGDEDVVVAGGVEPVADGRPEIARHEGVDEAELGESARRGDEGNELEVGADVGRRFGIARDFVGLVWRRIGGRLEVEELPARLKVGETFGIDDQSGGRVEGRGRVDDCAVDEFPVVGVHGCWLMAVGWLVCWNADRLRDTQSFDRIGVATTPRFGIFVSFCAATPQLDSVEGSSPLIQRGSFTTERGGESRVGGELDAELRGSSAGLARVGCVGADKRGSCLVKGFCRVGLLHRVVADGEGVELALHNRRAGRQ